LISIIGGKLTTYRKIARQVVDRVASRLSGGVRIGPSVTDQIRLGGGPAANSPAIDQVAGHAGHAGRGLAPEETEHLKRTYGGNYRTVLEIIRQSPELKKRLPGCEHNIEAEVVYAARHEMAVTVDDFLTRRTRISLVARDRGATCLSVVAELMGRELGWSGEQMRAAVADYRARLGERTC
jgi:glycerol-3-phosphate dehydrogenase